MNEFREVRVDEKIRTKAGQKKKGEISDLETTAIYFAIDKLAQLLRRLRAQLVEARCF